ncbi:hypothetical protein PPERSA_10360 [Pseudocohnilembus persalinus]|uniref:Uncharacterized protein n=1 Tax=Pseudocohnilembus persalinus TaxID=266149 RepID=A0A0V0QNG1_PSEPJ|nr:hypothetical protein PPERSA_10360 [Pseudocohnilembus persalinus]|eukprot:KRX03676.1 hypothetical protein PPERSA_10360 [Pseudocohnilembus persalinus]
MDQENKKQGKNSEKGEFLIQIQKSIEEQRNLNELIQQAKTNYQQQQNLQNNLQNMRNYFDDLGKQCFTVSELILNLQELSEKFWKENKSNQKLNFHRQQKEKIDKQINEELEQILGQYQNYSDEILLGKIESLDSKYQEVNKQKKILREYLENYRRENQWLYQSLELKVKNIKKINKCVWDLSEEFIYFLDSYLDLDLEEGGQKRQEELNQDLKGKLEELMGDQSKNDGQNQKLGKKQVENSEGKGFQKKENKDLENRKKIRKLSAQLQEQVQNDEKNKKPQRLNKSQNLFFSRENQFLNQDIDKNLSKNQNLQNEQKQQQQLQQQLQSVQQFQTQNSCEYQHQDQFTNWNTEAEAIDALDDLKQQEKQFKDLDIDYSFLNQDMVQQLFEQQNSAFCCYGHSFVQNSSNSQSFSINNSMFNWNQSKYMNKQEMEERNLG